MENPLHFLLNFLCLQDKRVRIQSFLLPKYYSLYLEHLNINSKATINAANFNIPIPIKQAKVWDFFISDLYTYTEDGLSKIDPCISTNCCLSWKLIYRSFTVIYSALKMKQNSAIIKITRIITHSIDSLGRYLALHRKAKSKIRIYTL